MLVPPFPYKNKFFWGTAFSVSKNLRYLKLIFIKVLRSRTRTIFKLNETCEITLTVIKLQKFRVRLIRNYIFETDKINQLPYIFKTFKLIPFYSSLVSAAFSWSFSFSNAYKIISWIVTWETLSFFLIKSIKCDKGDNP